MVNDILETHRDEIIDEFVASRMASYYDKNPDVAAAAERMLDEAVRLLEISPSASLVFSQASVEITLRDVLLKPIASGMIHDEPASPLIVGLISRNNSFMKLVLNIIEEYGFELSKITRNGSSKTRWVEMKDYKDMRQHIVHEGAEATQEQAETSLEMAEFLLRTVYPTVRMKITGN